MGDPKAAHLDVEALRDIAGRYGSVADELADATRTRLAALAFSGAMAGRAHGARGESLRSAVQALGEHLRTWARATDEIAGGLQASTASYRGADARAGARVG